MKTGLPKMISTYVLYGYPCYGKRFSHMRFKLKSRAHFINNSQNIKNVLKLYWKHVIILFESAKPKGDEQTVLEFLGRGSAFHTENNCAFYTRGSRLILLDCPMSAFHRLRHIGIDKLAGGRTEKVTVLVTHTHSDHVSGIGMLIHYCYYLFATPVEIIVPCADIAEDIRFLTERLDGCHSSAYRIICAQDTDTGFTPIPTYHAPELDGRCFGWSFDTNGKRVVYTGDTNTLAPFMPYLTDGAYLYTEISSYPSPVHLSREMLSEAMHALKAKGIRVYFMHLDNEEELAETARELGAELAPLYVQKQAEIR